MDDTPPLPEPPAPQPGRGDPRVYRLLRGLELGRLDAARRDLALAREAWNRTGNILRGTPYSADRRVLARIVETNDNFENLVMPRALLYWSPERRGKILAALEKIMPLTEELRLLRFLCSAPGDRDSAARLLGDIYSADPGRLIKRGPETVKRALAQLSKIYLRTIKSRGSGGAGALAALRGVPARAALYPGLVDMSLAGKEASGEEFEELVRRLRSGADPEAALRLYAARPDNPAYLALALSHDGAAPRALRIAVENPALLLRLASSELARGEKKNALGLLGWTENYARLEAGDRHAAALIYQEAGLFKEALRSLNQAASASPADGKLLNDRGVLVLLEGDSAAAEKDFRRALELSPDLPDAALNLASLLARKGERREAGDIYLGLLRRGDLEAGLRAAIERELAGVKE